MRTAAAVVAGGALCVAAGVVIGKRSRSTSCASASSSVTAEAEASVEVKQTQAGLHEAQSHFDASVPRRGLGADGLLIQLNHIGLIVSDVGRSAAFYSDVIGLQQLRRPDFDRHGAWFTLGNVELHLIKGKPLTYDGTHLIVQHLSIDVADTRELLNRLEKLHVPFERNISVPNGRGKGASEGGRIEDTLVQYFIRDPDGHYLELCNCQLLTDFCFSRDATDLAHKTALHTYEEGVPTAACGGRTPTFSFFVAVRLVVKALQARKRLASFNALLATEAAEAALAAALAPASSSEDEEEEAPPFDEPKWRRLCARRLVYGDLTQTVSEHELRSMFVAARGSIPATMLAVAQVAGARGHFFQPPAYLRSKDEPGCVYTPPKLCVSLVSCQ